MYKILSVGAFSCYGASNTCTHRTQALEHLADVTRVDTATGQRGLLYRILNCLFVRYRLPVRPPRYAFNDEIIRCMASTPYDVLWIDKGLWIKASTLRTVKSLHPNCLIVGYSPDNMVERHNQSQDFLDTLSLYDYYITTKSYTIESLKRLGCREVLFVNNAYEESFHHPYELTKEERERLGGAIGFIGSWEAERAQSILSLAQAGLPVRVWGGGRWLAYQGQYPNLRIESGGLFTEDYNKALSAFDISLCFLRKINYDLQTTRTMEIPACGSLLMAERTSEHEALFEDGREAVFFSNDEELLEKCRYYLEHTEERRAIADAGRARCLRSGYSNIETLRRVLDKIVPKE